MKRLNPETTLRTEAKLLFDPPNYTKKHESQNSWKRVLIAMIPGDLCEYYAWFLQKRFNLKLNTPLRDAHMTIVNDRRSEISDVAWETAKKQWNKNKITIFFDTCIRSNGEYWWLRSDSAQARLIRKNYLEVSEVPYFNYHITVGFPNEKNRAHSDYILRQCERFNI